MGTQMRAALGIVVVLLLFTICKSWIFDSDAWLKKVAAHSSRYQVFDFDPRVPSMSSFCQRHHEHRSTFSFFSHRLILEIRNRLSRMKISVAFPTAM